MIEPSTASAALDELCAGARQCDVAQRHELSRSQVCRLAAAARAGGRLPAAVSPPWVVELGLATDCEIARRYGIVRSTVQARRRRMGIEAAAPRGRPRKG